MKAPNVRHAEARPFRTEGYILLESVVAMVVLSLGIYAVHGTIRQAIITRGQSEDYTRVQFLLEQVMAQAALQPRLTEGRDGGFFEQSDRRFVWQYTIRKVDVPKPKFGNAQAFGLDDPSDVVLPAPYLAHVHATITWKRAGREFSESMETLYNPNKLWLPPEVSGLR